MYREPDATPRCVSCGATQITPPTLFKNTEGLPCVYFLERGKKAGWSIDTNSKSFSVNRARVCLACGHVMLALSPHELEDLRAKAAELEPYERD